MKKIIPYSSKNNFFITFAFELEWWCPVMPLGYRG